jgi:hypothetical protein
VEQESTGDNIGLVIRLQVAADGMWSIQVDGTHTLGPIPLAPATLVVRLQRLEPGGVLRGTVGLHGSENRAPFQSNRELERLVRAWLSLDESI